MNIKPRTVLKWCDIFGIELVDNDGFRGFDINKTEITLDLFLEGINVCTINPIDRTRYCVLRELTGW